MAHEVLTVYTTPYCGDCYAVKRFLAARNVRYREVDLERDAGARDVVRRMAHGHLSVPTLVFPDGRVLVEPPLGELAEALAVR